MALISQDTTVIKMFRGDDHHVRVTVKRKLSTPPYTLVVQNTAGSTSFLTVKKLSDDAPLVLLQGVPFGDGSTGELAFDFVPADTENLAPCPYTYDIQALIAGKTYTVAKGVFNLQEDVTRPGDVLVVPPPIPPVPPASFAKAFVFLAPAAAEVDAVHAAHLSSDPSLFPGPTTNPSTPRNLTATFGVGWDGGDITVVGTDQFDAAIIEVFAAAGGTTVAGVKVFKTVTSITKAVLGVTASASVGVGNKIGIVGRLFNATSALLFVDNIAEGATLDDTYDAFTPLTSLPDGVVNYSLLANVTE